MLATSAATLGRRAAGRHVLAIQDTTELNFEAHAGRTRGLGRVGNGVDHGFFLHPVLAVDAASGGVLGLAGAKLWNRTKRKRADYRRQPIEQKESYRWLEGAESAKAALGAAAVVTVIADRESDIYEEFARIPGARTHLLTRVCRDRSVQEGGCLYAFADALPERHRYRLTLPALRRRAARQAEMALRFAPVTIRRPAACPDKSLPPCCTLWLIDVREIDAPAGAPPVHWRLLTTHRVDSVAQALELVGWYCQRWHVEQLFRTLKRQGFDVESSQMESAAALMKLAVVALIGAVRTLQLTLARTGRTAQPAADAFDAEDRAVLATLLPTLEGTTTKQKNPHPPDSLAWAAWIIARLGGWKGYASERPPGPITMHHGLLRFDAIRHGYHLAQNVCIR
jgi:hypothetical protein